MGYKEQIVGKMEFGEIIRLRDYHVSFVNVFCFVLTVAANMLEAGQEVTEDTLRDAWVCLPALSHLSLLIDSLFFQSIF